MSTNNSVFTINIPDDWKETTVFTFEGPNEDGLLHNLVVVIDPFADNDTDIKSYVQSQIKNGLDKLSGFELVYENETEQKNNRRCYEICYKHVPVEDVVLYQKQLYITDKKGMYIFTSGYTKKTMQTVAYEVDRIIESFRFFDDKTMREMLK